MRRVEEERSAEQDHFAWASQEVTSELNHGDYMQPDNVSRDVNQGALFDTAANLHPDYSDSSHADTMEADGEDPMDDDMMDKISSSPSIDDGKFPTCPLWLTRISLSRGPTELSETPGKAESNARLTPMPNCEVLFSAREVSWKRHAKDNDQLPLVFSALVISRSFPAHSLPNAPLLQHHHRFRGEYVQSLDGTELRWGTAYEMEATKFLSLRSWHTYHLTTCIFRIFSQHVSAVELEISHD